MTLRSTLPLVVLLSAVLPMPACEAPEEPEPEPEETPWTGPGMPILFLERDWPRFIVDYTVGSTDILGETSNVPAFLRVGTDGKVYLGCASTLYDSEWNELQPRIQTFLLPPPGEGWATIPSPEAVAVADGIAAGRFSFAYYAAADVADLDGDGAEDLFAGGYVFQPDQEGLLYLVAAEAWRAADLVPGAPRRPTWDIPWAGGTPPGVVGDVDGRGAADFIYRTEGGIHLVAGEDFTWSGVPTPRAILEWPESKYLLPQPVGDLTGDGVDDLLLGSTLTLTEGTPASANNPVALFLWEGGPTLPETLRESNALATIYPLVDNREFPGSGRYGPATPHGPMVAAAGDINGDGWIDLAVVSDSDGAIVPGAEELREHRDGAAVRVFWGDGRWSGEYRTEGATALRDAERSVWNSEVRPGDLVVDDIDGDGLADVLMQPWQAGFEIPEGVIAGVAAFLWSGRSVAEGPVGEEGIDFPGTGVEPTLAVVDWDDYPPADDPEAINRSFRMGLGPDHLVFAAFSTDHSDCGLYAVPRDVLGQRLAQAAATGE